MIIFRPLGTLWKKQTVCSPDKIRGMVLWDVVAFQPGDGIEELHAVGQTSSLRLWQCKIALVGFISLLRVVHYADLTPSSFPKAHPYCPSG